MTVDPATLAEQLVRACISGDALYVEALLNQAVDVNTRWQSSTGLMWATLENHPAIVGPSAEIGRLY